MSDGPKLKTILKAGHTAELTTKLAELDTYVPPRSERRKTHNSDHEEYYCIAHLLATLSALGKFSFPLTLYKRQSPDFQLSMTSNKIGIEHTEAVSENAIRLWFMQEEENRKRKQKNLPPKVYFLPKCTPGEAKKTKEELQNDGKNPGVGWVGDSCEYEWAEAIAIFVEKKLEAAQKPHFTSYPTNWLIVFDNWPVPFFEYAEAASYLTPYLNNMNAFSVFDAIFVHDSSQMCEFRKSDVIIHSLVKPDIKSCLV